jgi:hypothetical protein
MSYEKIVLEKIYDDVREEFFYELSFLSEDFGVQTEIVTSSDQKEIFEMLTRALQLEPAIVECIGFGE